MDKNDLNIYYILESYNSVILEEFKENKKKTRC